MVSVRIIKLPLVALIFSMMVMGCSKGETEPPVLLDPDISNGGTPGTTFKVNGIEYYYISENACGISINPYLSGGVNIPEKVGSYNIIEVGDNAFNGNDITSISLPSTIQSIGKSAFENCAKLKGVDFQQLPNLQIIGEFAFKNSGLNSIELPNSVNTIGKGAFENNKLKKVDFQNPRNLQTLKENTFRGCTIENILLSESIKEIEQSCFENCRLNSIDLQGSKNLQTINENAFKGSSIQNISFPQSVEQIGTSAFENCTLNSLDLQDSKNLQTINENTFKGSSIQKISLPQSVKQIGTSAFENCKKLNEVNFPNLINLQIIKHSAFLNTSAGSGGVNLSNLSKLETIDDYAFANSSASQLILNNCTSLKSIGNNAFENNISLTKIEWSNCKALTTIGSEAFKSIGYWGCVIDFSPLVSLSKIGDGAFRESNITSPEFTVQGMGQYVIDLSQCKSLKEIPPYFMYKTSHTINNMEFSIILPPSITKIHEMAFASTSHSRGMFTHHLVCLATTPPEAASSALYLGKSSYENIEYLYNIRVPAASVDSYKQHSFWGKHPIKEI